MTESQDMQKKPIFDFLKLLQERLDKVNPRRKQAKPLRTMQLRLLSNPPLPKNRYPINKSVNHRLKITR